MNTDKLIEKTKRMLDSKFTKNRNYLEQVLEKLEQLKKCEEYDLEQIKNIVSKYK